jgi:putative thioredoxin
VQSIPLVVAIKNRKAVDSFLGAQPEQFVRQWVNRLLPTEEESEVERLVAAGDEGSLRRALELDPDNEAAIAALGELLATSGRAEEALELIGRIPETPATRRVAAIARAGGEIGGADDIQARLDALLDRVKDDEDARKEYVDLLELLGPDDPRTVTYRKQLASRLY